MMDKAVMTNSHIDFKNFTELNFKSIISLEDISQMQNNMQ